MTDKKVSELDTISSVDDADFMPIVDDSETSGKNKKVTVQQLKDHIGGLSHLSDGSNITDGYTNQSVPTTTVSSHLVPDVNITHDLGTPEKKFRDLYLSSATIHLGDGKISSKTNGEIEVAGVDSSSDLIVDNTARGVVLKSPNGTFWRLTVDDNGDLMSEDIGTEKP
jgi:hypothetical protein